MSSLEPDRPGYAAYELSQAKMVPLVFEQDTVVGGIARTVQHAGYRFDIGGHRFFTKVQSIDDWWETDAR